MTDSTPTNVREFCVAIADVCDQAASLFLQDDGHFSVGGNPDSPWRTDRGHWLDELSSDRPAVWISEITSTYVSESAYQLKALGELLRVGQVTGTLDLLVRAILERAGRVIWVLDTSVGLGTKVRAARAGLEVGVSFQHYREALHDLGLAPEDRVEIKSRDAEVRDLLLSKLATVRPPNDPDDEKSKPTKEMNRWTVEGESYPTFAAIAQLAGTRCGLTAEQARGTYAGLCGYAHPSVVFARENRSLGPLGLPQFEYRASDIEKVSRMGVLTFLEATRHCASYYESGLDVLDALIAPIHQRVDELGGLAPEILP